MPRIVRFHQTGGPETLSLDEVEVPSPGENEVLIETKALGINRAEVAFRQGQYMRAPLPPSKIGYEAAGVVREVGAGVHHVRAGDAVSVMPAFDMGESGVHGELVLAPAHAVVKHPEDLSWEQAAAVWMQYTTAYTGLVEIAGTQAGDVVLITAASSSVGLAAIQMCNMLGATPVALTRTTAKKQALLDHGAAEVIVTEEQDIVEEVQRITEGKGADVFMDPVLGPTMLKLLEALGRGGTGLLYAHLSPEFVDIPTMQVLGKGLTVRGFTLFELTTDPDRQRKAVDFIREGLGRGQLSPVINKTFNFENFAEAHRYMESNNQIGKIVVTVP